MVSPDFSHFLSYIVVGNQFVRVVVFGDCALVISQGSLYPISERLVGYFERIVP